MYFQYDADSSKKAFEEFRTFIEQRGFKGTIRRSAEDLGVAEIIDEQGVLKKFRFWR